MTTKSDQVKLRVRVYSDRPVGKPDVYFERIFEGYYQYWTQLESDDENCILCETTKSYDFNTETLDDLYDSITPVMYQSSSRSYIKV